MKTHSNNFYKFMKSPVGKLTLIANEKNLIAVLWPDEELQRTNIMRGTHKPSHPILLQTEQQLTEYFCGDRRHFDLPLEFIGTEFQKKVWNGLRQIKYGATASYSQLAATIGLPRASRAAGAANGRNPISIIVPCHRVIGKNGKLTGFAGGLETKQYLLNLEAR